MLIRIHFGSDVMLIGVKSVLLYNYLSKCFLNFQHKQADACFYAPDGDTKLVKMMLHINQYENSAYHFMMIFLIFFVI